MQRRRNRLIGGTVIGMLIFIALLMIVLPQYSVWQKELKGKAALREAEWDRKILIEEAHAQLVADSLNAQAEVIRARGMAEAIRIEGGGLTDRYIQYLWVRSNKFNENTTIYVPTEANLPILEATRRRQVQAEAVQ
jgi:hypothetical protein